MSFKDDDSDTQWEEKPCVRKKDSTLMKSSFEQQKAKGKKFIDVFPPTFLPLVS